MGSSRASTPAGRRQTAKRAADARGGAPRREAAHRKPAGKKATAKKAPAKKPSVKKAPAKRTPPRKPSTSRARGLPILIGLLVGAVVLGGVYQFWFRNSTVVAITEVEVTGARGPQAEEAATALTEAAKAMTTLNVDQDRLDAVAARFVTVAGVEAQTDFPSGLTVSINERPPVLVVRSAGRAVPVAGDGTILSGVEMGDVRVPEVEVAELSADGKVTGDALALATVAGAAPEPLRGLITGLEADGEEGLTVILEGDIPVYFGDSARADERWAAATAVLADPKIDTLTYVDVRVPERPAIGGAAPQRAPEPVLP